MTNNKIKKSPAVFLASLKMKRAGLPFVSYRIENGHILFACSYWVAAKAMHPYDGYGGVEYTEYNTDERGKNIAHIAIKARP